MAAACARFAERKCTRPAEQRTPMIERVRARFALRHTAAAFKRADAGAALHGRHGMAVLGARATTSSTARVGRSSLEAAGRAHRSSNERRQRLYTFAAWPWAVAFRRAMLCTKARGQQAARWAPPAECGGAWHQATPVAGVGRVPLLQPVDVGHRVTLTPTLALKRGASRRTRGF
ncbi:hypothetical protein MTO96_024475 [Rhipicephalus appendiculatus]